MFGGLRYEDEQINFAFTRCPDARTHLGEWETRFASRTKGSGYGGSEGELGTLFREAAIFPQGNIVLTARRGNRISDSAASRQFALRCKLSKYPVETGQ